MIFDDYENVSEDTIEEAQKLFWDFDARYALIAFLLLSIDNKPDAESIKKLEAFMGISKIKLTDNEKEKEKQIEKHKELEELKFSVINECNAFLDNLDRDESYCDCIISEMENIIHGNEECNIGSGYSIGLFASVPGVLPGGAHFIFDFLKMVMIDGDCSENQKRILKYLARKWKIEKSVILTLEDRVKALEKTKKIRAEIDVSHMPHNEAKSLLSDLDKEEKEIWLKLNEFGITNERAIDAENYKIGKNMYSGFFKVPPKVIVKDDYEEDDDETEEYGIADRIGDGIVEGIMKVGEVISAPFEWLSGVR